jgi:predicted oxidoreductase
VYLLFYPKRADRALAPLLEDEFDTALLLHKPSVTTDPREKRERFATLGGRL